MTPTPDGPRTPGRAETAALVAALVAVAAVAAVNDHQRSIWVDEAFSLQTAGRSLPDTVRQAIRFEMQPPFYFVLLNLWLRLSATLEAARALSTVCVLLTLWVLHRLGRALGLGARGVSLPLLCALLPFVLWSASEARGYALTLLLTTCCTFFFVRAFLCPGARALPYAAGFVLFAWLSLMTFYLSGFLLLAQGIAGLLLSPRRRMLVLCLTLVGLLMLPWLPVVASQVDAHPIENEPLGFLARSGLARAGGALAWLAGSLLDVLFPAPVMRRPAARAGMLLLAVGALALRLRRGSRWGRLDTAFAITGLVPFLLVGALQLFDLAWILERHRVVAVSNLLVFAAVLVAGLEPARLRTALVASGVGAFAVAAISFQRSNEAPHDWRAAAAFVQERSAPGEPLILFEPDQALAFRHHFRGANPVFGMPRDSRPDVYAREEQVVHGEADVRERLRATVGSGRTFWLIANAYALPRPGRAPQAPHGPERRLGGSVLEAYVLGQTTVLATREFHGVRVWRLRTRPEA